MDNIESKEHIVFGGSATANTQELHLPIGFCWTERATNLGSLPPQEWQTFGQSGGAEVNHHLITGKKNKVLLEDSTEHYLVYFRDKFLAEKYEQETPEDESNPASDPFVDPITIACYETRKTLFRAAMNKAHCHMLENASHHNVMDRGVHGAA